MCERAFRKQNYWYTIYILLFHKKSKIVIQKIPSLAKTHAYLLFFYLIFFDLVFGVFFHDFHSASEFIVFQTSHFETLGKGISNVLFELF